MTEFDTGPGRATNVEPLDERGNLEDSRISIALPLTIETALADLKFATNAREADVRLDDISATDGSIQRLDHNIYICQGFEIELGMASSIAIERANLEGIKDLNLKSAPTLVRVDPIGMHDVVAVRNYQDSRELPLLPFDGQSSTLHPVAKEMFMREMDQLYERGVGHAFAHRGHDFWRINSDNGMIVLTSWAMLTPMGPPQIAEARQQLTRLLEEP
jgi:hypothetical protein